MTHPEQRALLPSIGGASRLQDNSLLGSVLRCIRRMNPLLNEDAGAPIKRNSATKPMSLMKKIQFFISLTLLGACVSLCTAGIIAKQTPVAAFANPVIALVLMWVLILWLGILEGGQGCLVGLQPVNPNEYQASHPYTYESTQLAHKGGNLNRFIVGRQFLVVLVVFLLNMACTVVVDFDVPGIPHVLMSGVVASGLAVMLITVMLGQLAAEVNATNCMLDFANSPVVWLTTVLCLAIEASGLLHSVYLVQCFFSSESSNETTSMTTRQQVWYWARVFVSVTILTFALVVTCDALWHDETTMYPGLSTISNFVLFFGLVCFLGLLEGIQIAAFAVVKLPSHIVASNPAADANCQLVFSGRNFKAVLIGRQICVTTSMFLLARITTTDVDPTDLIDTSTTMSTVLGLPAGIQDFFNTGLPGALITTIVASLWWRILAASFPIAFMGNPVVYWTIRLCLCLEASGVFSAAWLLADGIKRMLGYQPDDLYLNNDLELCKSGSTLHTVSSSDNEENSSTEYGTSTSEEFDALLEPSLSF